MVSIYMFLQAQVWHLSCKEYLSVSLWKVQLRNLSLLSKFPLDLYTYLIRLFHTLLLLH